MTKPDYIFVEETNSTNDLLRVKLKESNLPELQVAYTDFQMAGRGQTGNSWESEKGKNLLFSVLFYPQHIALEQHFIMSELIAVSVAEVLNEITPGFQVKWPNDIYFGEKKIAGILIENTFQGNSIKTMVAGIGININQKTFKSNAPNPVSLFQITGKVFERQLILDKIIDKMADYYQTADLETIRTKYFSLLYRKNGFHLYQTDSHIFSARIKNIYPDGKLELETEKGEMLGFYFKEVEFLRENYPD